MDRHWNCGRGSVRNPAGDYIGSDLGILRNYERRQKVKKSNKEAVLFWSLAILALGIVLACIIVTVLPRDASKAKAQRYDLECVAGRSRKPLEECKK